MSSSSSPVMGIGMQNCSPVTTPIDTSVKLTSAKDDEALADPKEYASIVGGLMFAACITRPDITCAVDQLSQFLNNPLSKHILTVNRIPLQQIFIQTTRAP